MFGVARNALLPRPFDFVLEYSEGTVNALATLLRQKCPSLAGTNQAWPTRWLPSGHMQTVWSAVADFTNVDKVEYKRKVIMTPDGGLISLDIAPLALAEPTEEEAVPTVVILHGLTGGSYESYVRNTVAKMVKPKEEGGAGMRCVVVNFRGCAHTPVTSPQLYSACKTTDLECAMLLLTRMFPQSPMLAMGFSLGGAIMTKFMGEVGKSTPFIGAIAVGAPFELQQTSDCLESTWVSMVYSYAMGTNLGSMVRNHADTLALSPAFWSPLEMMFGTKVDPDPTKPIAMPSFQKPRKGTLRFVDHVITRLGGGLPSPYGDFPFESAEAYYQHSSPLRVIHNVARPLLALNADDDPIVSSSTLQHVVQAIQGNPNVVLARSKCGGHLGWFAGPQGERWIYHPIIEATQALFTAHDEAKSKPSTGIGSGGPQINPWRVRQVDKKMVQLEVLPRSALPSIFESKSEEKNPSPLVWLRTQVLQHIPLLHPNDSPKAEAPIEQGDMLTVPMYTEALHPEVGFAEIPNDLAVGGNGTIIVGHAPPTMPSSVKQLAGL